MNKYGSFAGGVLKALFKKPATYGYPYNKREFPERTRGHIVIDIDNCILCGLCEKKCPSSAIKVDRNKGTWSIDRMGCVQCENCVVGCPKKVLSTDVSYTEPSTTKTVDTFTKAGAEVNEEKGASMPNCDLDTCVFCGLCAKNCPQGALSVDRASKSWKLDETLCVSCGLCVEKCPKKCLEMGADQTKKDTVLAPYDVDDLPKADLSACVYCGLCSAACPQGAIEMDRDSKKWIVNEDKCIHCGICYYKCPKKCITMKVREHTRDRHAKVGTTPEAVLAVNPEDAKVKPARTPEMEAKIQAALAAKAAAGDQKAMQRLTDELPEPTEQAEIHISPF